MGKLHRIGLALALLLSGASVAAAQSSDAATAYVGSAACAGCHEAESAAWRGSHHDLAMAEATEATVLGDFDNATFTDGGVTSRFFRRYALSRHRRTSAKVGLHAEEMPS